MIHDPEVALLQTLQAQWTLFQTNAATLIPDVYADESAANQADLLAWWAKAPTVLITAAYALAPPQLPLLWVKTLNDDEVPDRQFVGRSRVPVGGLYAESTTLACHLEVGIFATNANEVRWLALWVRWALWSATHTLETQYGLFQQRLSAGPLEPVPDSAQDVVFPFWRRVWFQAQHEDTWRVTPTPGALVQATSVEVQADAAETP